MARRKNIFRPTSQILLTVVLGVYRMFAMWVALSLLASPLGVLRKTASFGPNRHFFLKRNQLIRYH